MISNNVLLTSATSQLMTVKDPEMKETTEWLENHCSDRPEKILEIISSPLMSVSLYDLASVRFLLLKSLNQIYTFSVS